jgi:flagellar basal body-associated protein FliL
MRSLVLAALAALLLVAPAYADDGGDSGGDGKGKAPKHKVTQSPSYVEVDPMYATILDDDHPVGMLMIGVGLDIPDEKLRDEAVHAMPVLRDAYVRNMMNFSTTSVRSWKQPDVAVIADRLQAVTDRALGRKGAKLLLAQVAMRVTK